MLGPQEELSDHGGPGLPALRARLLGLECSLSLEGVLKTPPVMLMHGQSGPPGMQREPVNLTPNALLAPCLPHRRLRKTAYGDSKIK